MLAEFSGENFIESQSFYVSYERSIDKVSKRLTDALWRLTTRTKLLAPFSFYSCPQIAHCKVESSSLLRCLLPPFTAAGNASITEPLRERLALHLLQADDCAASQKSRVRRDLLLTLTQSASAIDSSSDDYGDSTKPLGPFVVEVHPDPVLEPLSTDQQPLFVAHSPLLIRVCEWT